MIINDLTMVIVYFSIVIFNNRCIINEDDEKKLQGKVERLIFFVFLRPKINNKKIVITMYAIVEIAGQQFKIEKDRRVYVQRLQAEEGSQVKFDRVMLVDNDGDVKVGTPTVDGAAVTATVVKHLKGDKVLVFKKKRRKGYQKLNGHRQCLTAIKIDEISL